MKDKFSIRLSFTSLFAALIAVAGFIKIPLGIIPIAFQNIICLLSGAIIGGFSGVLPVILFLFVGFLGFPVYSGGTGGISIWIGPTGGFLVGYLFGTLVTSCIVGKAKSNSKFEILKIILGIVFGSLIIYFFGILGCSRVCVGLFLPYSLAQNHLKKPRSEATFRITDVGVYLLSLK